jgi:homoserine O-acetyltransferase/O-succinyltransferase
VRDRLQSVASAASLVALFVAAPPTHRHERIEQRLATRPRIAGAAFGLEHSRICGRLRTAIAGLGLTVALTVTPAEGANYPPPKEGDFTVKDFRFASGESLPQLRIHYRTFGTPRKDAHGVVRNAVLILHGTGGTGGSLVRVEFAGELFGPGQLLDATRYFIVLPDGIGHGQSSKPSDGLRARFPHYGYRDMVQAQYLLLTQGLKVNHARLIIGTSMGAMHTWLWGELHPQFMDALMPLASLPTQVAGRNRVWRRLIIDAIRNDPDWHNGEYSEEPPSLRTALEMIWLMGSNPALRQQEAPTLADADRVIDTSVSLDWQNHDANDILYAVDASHDYDPGPALEKITAPLLAVNSADDLINPPELGILEREIKRVPQGRAVVIPFSEHTHGHGSHTWAALWQVYLEELLHAPER